MRWSRVLAFIIKEFKEVIPPTVFFAVGFNIIALTTQLILDDYFVRFASFIVVITTALVVGKAVLVANALPSADDEGWRRWRPRQGPPFSGHLSKSAKVQSDTPVGRLSRFGSPARWA
jgi:hypothetical protein